MNTIRFSELCKFTPKQWHATDQANAHTYTLFGGSRGPGKSYWLRWWLVRFLMRGAAQGFRNMRVMMACEDYPTLTERQISKVQIEFPAWLGSFKAMPPEFKLKPAYGGGVIAFRNLDDPSKYQSAEYAAIAIDEVTKNPERTFHILRGSLRWPGFDGVRMVAASNPEANWVRSYFIEKRLPEELHGHEHEFAFVPALPTDNPHLPASYWQMLDTLPDALRQAWLHGDWYAAVEGLVLENFTDANMTDQEPDKERPFELSIDDGYVDPRATLFIQRQANGDILVFDELYQTKTLEERTIEDIKERCAMGWPPPKDEAERAAKKPEDTWPLPELAAVSHEAVALRERLRRANIPARNWLANPVKGEPSTRVAAITLTRSYVCDGQGYRALRVHKRCKRLLDEIMAGWKYPEGKNSINERPEDGNDHAADALTGWIWLRAKRQTT
jgi:phage terminase large subunit